VNGTVDNSNRLLACASLSLRADHGGSFVQPKGQYVVLLPLSATRLTTSHHISVAFCCAGFESHWAGRVVQDSSRAFRKKNLNSGECLLG